MKIAKSFDFDAAHWLPFVADGHKCKRMHGHTYRVEVACVGPLNAQGMICDYAEISAAWAPLHDRLDHRKLNDVPGLENPTTEILAPYILRELRAIAPHLPFYSVRVYESSTTWCEAM